jgi:CMP-N-acetylneuraminic acid synthetase
VYKYVAEIPARIGSNRVKKKNIRMLAGKPMIQYAIDACKGSKFLNDIYVNTDSDLIGDIALNSQVKYYKRDKKLGCDNTKQDQFNYDFLKNINCQFVVMVNPVSPLIETSDIDSAIRYFESKELDTLISVKKERLHAFFNNGPLNFETKALLPATQDIEPVLICTWSICIWRKETFIQAFESNGFAAFNGRMDLWEMNPMKTIKISYEEDFLMAEQILIARDEII